MWKDLQTYVDLREAKNRLDRGVTGVTSERGGGGRISDLSTRK